MTTSTNESSSSGNNESTESESDNNGYDTASPTTTHHLPLGGGRNVLHDPPPPFGRHNGDGGYITRGPMNGSGPINGAFVVTADDFDDGGDLDGLSQTSSGVGHGVGGLTRPSGKEKGVWKLGWGGMDDGGPALHRTLYIQMVCPT